MISPERSAWGTAFLWNERWVSRYQSLTRPPCGPPLLFPFICLCIPSANIHYVVGPVLRHDDTEMKTNVLCLWGAFGDAVHQQQGGKCCHRSVNACRGVLTAKEKTLLLGRGGEERLTQGLNPGLKDDGYTCSRSPVKSGEGSEIQPKMPT